MEAGRHHVSLECAGFVSNLMCRDCGMEEGFVGVGILTLGF